MKDLKIVLKLLEVVENIKEYSVTIGNFDLEKDNKK